MSPLRRGLLMAAIGGLAGGAGYFANLWRIGGMEATATANADRAAAAAILNGPLTDLEDAPQTLTEFRGKVLIVNYWATWCAPCREEIPIFVRLQQEYGAKGLQFAGIAIDQADKVRAFAREFHINYPLFIGGVEALNLARQAGNKAGALPYTLVVDRSENIAARLLGGVTEARMVEQFKALL